MFHKLPHELKPNPFAMFIFRLETRIKRKWSCFKQIKIRPGKTAKFTEKKIQSLSGQVNKFSFEQHMGSWCTL